MRNQRSYTLEEMEELIFYQLVDTHSRYKYMTDFVFPLINQKTLRKIYPGILSRLQANSEDAVIIGLAKLIDNSNDPRLVTFKKFIKTALNLPSSKIINRNSWQEFRREAKLFLKDLEELNRNLNPLRNKFRAHLAPKTPSPPKKTTWKY